MIQFPYELLIFFVRIAMKMMEDIMAANTKKINPITIGAIIDPKNKPNLNHNIFNGLNIFEFINMSFVTIKCKIMF